MEDLSQWDLAFEFTAHEAACLIRGLDPQVTPNYSPAIAPILRAMRISYEHVLWGHQDDAILDEMEGGHPKGHLEFVFPIQDRKIFAKMKDEADESKFDPRGLHCARISSFYDELDSYLALPRTRESEGIWELDIDRFNRWLRSPDLTAFDAQRFTRDEIHRWLLVKGIQPKYCFAVSLEPSEERSVAIDGSTPSEAQKGTTFVSLKGRRHALSPIIEAAASKCRNPHDVAEIWPHLQELARQKTPPLLGVTAGGIKYIDDMDTPKEFTKRALRERLRRQAR